MRASRGVSNGASSSNGARAQGVSTPPVGGRGGLDRNGGGGSSSPKAGAGAPRESGWTDELDALGRAFRRTFRALNRLRGRDTHLGGGELSHAQFELLIELYERGPLSAGELALAARLMPASVTQMLEHLADCGHVKRSRSHADRRVVVSALTPRGRRRIEAKRAAWQQRWHAALADLDPTELLAATRVLERLGLAFEDAAEDRPPSQRRTPLERQPVR